MELILYLMRRFQPRVGWPVALLALGAALAPSLAASSSELRLPAGTIAWAGALGLLLGADLARPVSRWPLRAARGLGAALLVVGGGAALLAAAGQALPPPGLIIQDLAALVGRARGQAGGEEAGLSARFLQESLPRLWRAILAAPTGGEAGARLITIVVATLGAWLSAVGLGRAVAARRPTYGWGGPVLAATGATAILGGGTASGLVPGMAMILGLGVATGVASRLEAWERQGADSTDEIGGEMLAWGGVTIAAALLVALAIPVSPPGWLTARLWGDIELPSGIAAIESQVQRRRPAEADVGLSELPAVGLGVSLQQGPDDQPALRVAVGSPLAASPWPRYWRSRVLEVYTGRSWFSAARAGAPLATIAPDDAPALGVRQDVEDLRPLRLTLIGLANPVAASVAAQAERLPDGSLAALSGEQLPGRYTLLSIPPEQASLPPIEAPPPDLRATLGLPAGVSERVRELARTVAGDEAGAYGQALALERYLRGLPYSYVVAPLPAGGDAVDQFLFEMRQGYCTYYASAMAVMARTLGIPARIAVGYASGSYEAGAYLVREGEAHAWPELYIDGRWLPFEPTPVRPLPDRGGPEVAPDSPEPPEPIADAAPQGELGPWLLGVSLALAAAGGVWLLRLRAASPLARALTRMERRGARAGAPWPPGSTLREYGGLLAARAGGERLPALIAQIEAATYGGRPLSREQEARLARDLDELLRRL